MYINFTKKAKRNYFLTLLFISIDFNDFDMKIYNYSAIFIEYITLNSQKLCSFFRTQAYILIFITWTKFYF